DGHAEADREQLLAHRLKRGLGLGAIREVELDLDQLSDAHVAHAGEAHAAHRPPYGVALRIEDLALERDVDVRLHNTGCSQLAQASSKFVMMRGIGGVASGTKG